ncbi:MAG: type II secretion system F family protein [Pirellulaceae bacterium]
MAAVSSLVVAAAVVALCWTVLEILTIGRTKHLSMGRFEEDRRRALRESSDVYRRFEPLIDEWCRSWPVPADKLHQIEENLNGAGVREPWHAEEYVNTKRVEGILFGICCGLIALFIMGSGLFGGLAAGWLSYLGHQWFVVRYLRSEAALRQVKMKRRFAATIDLMALMMEVGAGFQECLDVATHEARNNPLGEELALVKKEIAMGSLRSKALTGLARRTRDPDMAEVIMSINEGEELGTPLTSILRNQSEQMQRKRSQWAEKAAEESQVAIVFPAMLIMIACLAIVVAPFILSAIPGIQ